MEIIREAKTKKVIWADKEFREFSDATHVLMDKLKDIPGASDALRTYSNKLAKFISKSSEPGIHGNKNYCSRHRANNADITEENAEDSK